MKIYRKIFGLLVDGNPNMKIPQNQEKRFDLPKVSQTEMGTKGLLTLNRESRFGFVGTYLS